ncbi:MerR family transcriptional regulator [Bradyrhizobium elkanii]
MEYSLSDLVEATGAKRRSLQLWADRGVIRPIAGTANAGTGVHRLFSREEAALACLIHGFAMRQVSIGELVSISVLARVAIKDYPHALRGGGGNTIIGYASWYENGKRRAEMHAGKFTDVPMQMLQKPGAMFIAVRLETYLQNLK